MALFDASGGPSDFRIYLEFLGALPNRNINRHKIHDGRFEPGIMVSTDVVGDVIETVIVGGDFHGYTATYSTEEEALAGHEVAVRKVMTGE